MLHSSGLPVSGPGKRLRVGSGLQIRNLLDDFIRSVFAHEYAFAVPIESDEQSHPGIPFEILRLDALQFRAKLIVQFRGFI
jgi:hypothetical protein